MPTPTDLITPKKAAAILGVTPRTIRVMMSDGRLKGYTVAGTRKRVREADVRALIVEDGLDRAG